METPGSQSGTGAVSPDDADSEDAISTSDHSHPRMLYVAVEQNEDSYPFHQSRVSPLDPNLNSAQYSPTTRATTLLHQDSHIICPEGELQYTPNLHDSNLTSDHFSPSTPDIIMDTRYSSTGRLHNSRHLITQESIESAHFSPENTNLLTQDSNLSEGAFEHGISYVSRNMSEMDVNLSQSDYQTHSLLDQIQNVSSRNNIDFGSLANLSDTSYIMQLNTGQLLLKTVNGRYYQQVFHPNNIIINSHLYESNDMLSDNILTLSDNGVTRLSDDVLSDIQNGEDSIITGTDSIIRLSDNILNRDLEFNRFVHASNINNLLSNQKSIKTDEDSRITALKSNIKKHKFQSISGELLSNNDSASDISSEVFTITPHLANEVLSNGKLEEPDFNPDAVVENSNQGSIQTMLKNISEGDFSSDVYEMAPVYELADQDRDTCLVDDSDDIDIRDSKYSGEEFVLIDGGIYSLSNLRSQGFVIGQSGEIVLSQQSDGHLLNSNPNFGLNYNDQIVIDQNGRIMLKSSMDKDDTLLLHEADLNNMNVDNNLDEELELNHDIKAEVFGLKSDVIFEEECILDNCEAQELNPDETKDSREMSKTVESLRRSKRAVKVKADKDILTINDKQVQARAWGTLPAAYLSISKVAENDGKPVYGVLARKVIPACTQFGPVNGFKTTARTKSEIVTLEFKVKTDDGIVYLDVADEHLSNWMRFVRPADTFSEQNLVMTEQTGLLYFTSIKTIEIKSELRVWYGDEYAKEYGFRLLRPTETEKKVISKMENSWPCYECGERLASSEDLQIHLNEHDDIRISIQEKRLVRARRIRLAAHIEKLNPNTQEKDVASDTERKRSVHQCTLCDRIFPRAYSLNRHLLTHKSSGNALAQRKRLIPSPIMSNENNQNDSNHNESEIHTDRNTMVRSESIDVCEDDKKVKTNEDISILPHSTEEDAQSYHQDKQYKFIKPTTKFLCHLCPRRFVTKDKLDHHLSDHEESSEEYTKKSICTHCFKEFSNSTLLMCHVKTHMTLKCPMCEKIFSAVLDLREHVKVHCVDGYYTCSSCRKKFSDYSVIRKHIRAFHCEKKIPCPQCSKLFPKRDKLRMHLLKHSDHREFLCAHCGKQFKRKDKLKEHMKRIHSGSKQVINGLLKQGYLVECKMGKNSKPKRFMPKVSPNDYHRFIYKCHTCFLGFKRRGMLVNHLAKRHPDIKPESVPELNLPILKTTRDYYCQYCQKVYKSSSKRKAHILKNHPGLELPLSNRHKGGVPDIPGIPNPTFSQTVGSVTTHPHACLWCHKQYASKAKLLQHQRKKHTELLNSAQQMTVTQTEAVQSPNLKEINYEVVAPNANQYLKIVSSDTKMSKETNMTLLETDVDFESDPDDPEMLAEQDLEEGKKMKNTKDIVNDKQINGSTDNMTKRAVVELTDVEESRVSSSKLLLKNDKMSMKTYNLPELKSLSLTASELKHQKKWAVNYPFTSFAAR